MRPTNSTTHTAKSFFLHNSMHNQFLRLFLHVRHEAEQRKLKEREAAKVRQAEAMREVIQAAERLANEQKRIRRKCDKNDEENRAVSSRDSESNVSNENQFDQNCSSGRTQRNLTFRNDDDKDEGGEQDTSNENETNNTNNNTNNSSNSRNSNNDNRTEQSDQNISDTRPVQVPISKDVAIVLSGRIEDPELLNKANLQLVNLVLTPSPRKFENSSSNNLSLGLNSFIQRMESWNFASSSSEAPSTIIESRLLTPSKYRVTNGRDCGTQTDIENDLQDFQEKLQELTVKDCSMKDRKDATNASKRDIEK